MPAALDLLAVVSTAATLAALDAFTRAHRRTGCCGCPRWGHPLSSEDMTDGIPGAASRTYFSQRLRPHCVDWGHLHKPPRLMLHGARDHRRDWEWTAAARLRAAE